MRSLVSIEQQSPRRPYDTLIQLRFLTWSLLWPLYPLLSHLYSLMLFYSLCVLPHTSTSSPMSPCPSPVCPPMIFPHNPLKVLLCFVMLHRKGIGTETGTRNDWFLYYVMYCTLYTVAGTGNHYII